MCDWGQCQTITIRQEIVVDACLADLIVRLNEEGIKTTGCCCGHGKGPGGVTIQPSTADRARALGYRVELLPNGTPEIILGTYVRDDTACAAASPLPRRVERQ